MTPNTTSFADVPLSAFIDLDTNDGEALA